MKVLKNTLKTSEAQLELASGKLKAGSISQSDHAQIAAQFSSDQYQVIRGENQLNEQLLKLKQLLELDMDSGFQVTDYSVEENDILTPLPDKRYIYEQALLNLPSSRQQEINVKSAELDYKMATGLEALLGYLYVKDKEERILELLELGIPKKPIEDQTP